MVFVSASLAAAAPGRRGGKYPKRYLLPRYCLDGWRLDITGAAKRPSPPGRDAVTQAATWAREVKPSLARMCST